MTNAYWREFWGNPKRRTNPYGTPGRIYTKGYHRGEDIGSFGELANVPALRSGEIIDSGRSDMIGHWIAVKPDADPNRRDIYTHMFEGTSRKSGRINAGDIIGRLAGWGERPGTAWNGPHLHFVNSTRSHGGFDTSMPDYDPRPVITAALNNPGSPATTPKPQPTRGTARKVKTDAAGINGRSAPTTAAAVKQTLKDGTVGTFDGFIRGEKVAGNNIWFRGALGGNYWWSGNFENKSTTGLKDLGTYKSPVVKPKPKPVAKHTYARLPNSWFFYYNLNNALNGNYSHNQKVGPGDFLVVQRDSRGPVKIRVPGKGDVWVGTRKTRAPLITK